MNSNRKYTFIIFTILSIQLSFAQNKIQNDSIKNNLLKEIVVKGKSKSEIVSEQAINADVITTKNIQNEASSLTEIINRTSGIRVRQVGGLGSNANVFINGFQGKAVKYFKDGIPLDYLGAGFNINIVPVAILDRVEIYKGVLPTYLGADAMGGAINLVTKNNSKNYLNVSYELASFNTHRATFNTLYKIPKTSFFVGLDGFYNHSDNNYKVDVKIVDPFTRNLKEVTVNRFHDDYTNYYGEFFGGITNSKWADLFRIGITYFDIDKQEQHGASMAEPFGQVVTKQKSFVPTLLYKKKFWNKKADFSQFLTLSKLNATRIDTCHCTYDWNGNRIANPARQGEADSDGSLSNIDFKNFVSRTYFTYSLNGSQKIDANLVYTTYDRIGNDPFGSRYLYSGRDILTVPAGYDKLVGAVGLESKIKEKLSNTFILKYYYFKTNGTDAIFASPTEEQVTNSSHRFGVAEAIKYNLNENSFFRISGEYATRLPENSEVFGDGLFEMSNFNLKPEQSINLNLGYRTQKTQRYLLEINTFFRRATDIIVQVPTNVIFLQHQNFDKVKGFGLEADATINLKKWLIFGINFTYQDLRLFGITNPNVKFLEDSRVRNTPYFFGGASLKTIHRNVFKANDALQAYWYYNYVNEFYLEPIPKNKEAKGFFGIGTKANIDSELAIPNQNLHTIGLNYSLNNDRKSFGIEVKNLFDANLYDNFKIQKAGRSLHFKARFSIF